jgi:hypothetical protein
MHRKMALALLVVIAGVWLAGCESNRNVVKTPVPPEPKHANLVPTASPAGDVP